MEFRQIVPKPRTEPVQESTQPTLRTIKNFFKDCGVVGEEKNACLIVLAILNQKHTLISSQSGAGKTMLLDTAILLFDEADIYRVDFVSKQALMYDMDNFNKAKIIYSSELQKALSEPMVVDIFKSVTENKVVTNRKGISTQRIQEYSLDGRGKVALSTLAVENSFKTDAELERRQVTLFTDISEKQNRDVIKKIGETRFNKKRKKLLESSGTDFLKKHCREVLKINDLDFVNPFAPFISERLPSPSVKIRTHAKHFFDLIEAVTKFYNKDRVRDGNKIFVSIQDCIDLFDLYWEQFYRVVHDIGLVGKDILDAFEDGRGYKKNTEKRSDFVNEFEEDRTYLTISDMHNKLKTNKKNKVSVNHKVITDQCEKLIEGGFLEKEKAGTKTMYYRTGDDFNIDPEFDWNECLDQAQALMKEQYKEVYEKW